MRIAAILILSTIASGATFALVAFPSMHYATACYIIALVSMISAALIMCTVLRDWARQSIRSDYQSFRSPEKFARSASHAPSLVVRAEDKQLPASSRGRLSSAASGRDGE